MKIKLKVHRPYSRDLCGKVRINPEAETILRQSRDKTGLSLCEVVSQIIIQADEQDAIELDRS